jgi:hypothetical protein
LSKLKAGSRSGSISKGSGSATLARGTTRKAMEKIAATDSVSFQQMAMLCRMAPVGLRVLAFQLCEARLPVFKIPNCQNHHYTINTKRKIRQV